jgi:hypothetical protein
LCAIARHLGVADICNLRATYGTAAVPMLSLLCALDKIRLENPELADGAPESEVELADFIALFVCSDAKVSDYYFREVVNDVGLDYDSDGFFDQDTLGRDGASNGHPGHGRVGQDLGDDYDEEYESDKGTALSADAIADATSQWVPVPSASPLESGLDELGSLAELVRDTQNDFEFELQAEEDSDYGDDNYENDGGIPTESGLYDDFIDSVHQALNELEQSSNGCGLDLAIAEDHVHGDDDACAGAVDEIEHNSDGDPAGDPGSGHDDVNELAEASGPGDDTGASADNDFYSDCGGIADDLDHDDFGGDDGDFGDDDGGFDDDWDSGGDGDWDD